MSLAALSHAAAQYRRAIELRSHHAAARAAGHSDALRIPTAVDDERAIVEAEALLRVSAAVPVAAAPSVVELSTAPLVTVDMRSERDGGLRLLAAGELLIVPLGFVGPHDLYQLGEVMRFAARAALGARDEPGAHTYSAVEAWREVYAAAIELIDADLAIDDVRIAADDARDSPAARRFTAAAAMFVRTLRGPDDSGPNAA